MTLVCIVAFGNFVPGDEVEVPADAEFDHTYFERKPTNKPSKSEDK